jgi:hypothetical protein
MLRRVLLSSWVLRSPSSLAGNYKLTEKNKHERTNSQIIEEE